ncbi:hypothetical protein VE04_02960 [Pseudogymnoascus sp. 24MN13]|nr:hypothetical protein VE04_02960 [Pseudogymnoascus sp. 24MN13]
MRTSLAGTAFAVYECPKNDPVLTPICCDNLTDFNCVQLSRPPENLEMFEAICLAGQRAALCCDISKELVAGNC